MAVNFVTLRAKLIAALKANKTHSVNIVTPNVTTPDPTKPHRVTAQAPTLTPVDVLAFDGDMPEEGQPKRTVIIPGDVAVKPDCSKRIRFANGHEYAIAAISTYDQGGVDIGYKCECEAWPTSSQPQTQ